LKKAGDHLIYYFTQKYELGKGNKDTYVLCGIWKDLLGGSGAKYRKVAVKRIVQLLDPIQQSKFQSECDHLFKVKGHSNILQVYTTKEDDQKNFW